jgi:trimethylamine--corrinoid protein Co-methyltransferase
LETYIRVLSDEDRHHVHESSLKLLAHTGVRVDSVQARGFLREAGAKVDENTHIVRFPRSLVEESLRLAPRQFSLGARRPGNDLTMNQGQCSLVADGEGTLILDMETGEYRPTNYDDWLTVTLLLDALDEVGVYWTMVRGAEGSGSIPDMVEYWWHIFSNFSKHVQESIFNVGSVPWFLEILQVVFGDQATIRKEHPFSFLICPQSPLVIDEQYMDAYLELRGWNIPVAIMPMPLMGGTAPGNKISTVVQGNCETLAMICLIQAAEAGTPIIYAPVLGVMNPRTGLYSGGAIENAVLSSAAIEMGRYYDLPVEGSGGGTDQFFPGIQAGYERALTSILPVLSWPDLFVGPGLLGGSMILSLEQLMIDIEIYRINRHAHRGIQTAEAKWLEDVIENVGPAGNFLGERSTIQAIRSGTWLVDRLGVHEPLNSWQDAGKPTVQDEVRDELDEILSNHEPLPLSECAERELDHIYQRARLLEDVK